MKLVYLPIQFTISFEKALVADTNILFVLRSMIGKNLREMCCAIPKQKCFECLYSNNCLYSYLFDKKSAENHSHPFALTKGDDIGQKLFQEYSFEITLFGNAAKYYREIIEVVNKTGNQGIFKDRVKYSIDKIQFRTSSGCVDVESIDDTEKAISVWEYQEKSETDKQNLFHEVLLELKSPLRFKVNGSYSRDFSAEKLLSCFYRRTKDICSQFGEFEELEKTECNFKITETNIRWKDAVHYSARQKEAMELGGYVGTIKLSGNFTDYQLALLEFNKIVNAGKNTVFGLGQIDYWMR